MAYALLDYLNNEINIGDLVKREIYRSSQETQLDYFVYELNERGVPFLIHLSSKGERDRVCFESVIINDGVSLFNGAGGKWTRIGTYAETFIRILGSQ